MSRIATIGKLLLVIPLLAGPFAPTPTANAQEDVAATVPFGFSVNNQRLAAGKYQITSVSDHFLVLRDASTGKSQFLMVSPAWVDVIQSRGRLVFHAYGGHHYLSQVWIPGKNGYSALMQTRSERHLQRLRTDSRTLITSIRFSPDASRLRSMTFVAKDLDLSLLIWPTRSAVGEPVATGLYFG